MTRPPLPRLPPRFLVLLAALGAGAGAFAWHRSGLPGVIPHARTLYEGFVRIVPLERAELEARLRAKGCRPPAEAGRPGCTYRESSDAPGLLVDLSGGTRFGPGGVRITRDRLYAVQDVPGLPDLELYRQAVREELGPLADVVELVEGSWTITKATYPWTVVY